MYEHFFELLGKKAKDKVTGFKGVITSLAFDLYGCVQVVVTPPPNKDGELENGNWFDVTRIELLSDTPVMAIPDFAKGYVGTGKKGPAEKPVTGSLRGQPR